MQLLALLPKELLWNIANHNPARFFESLPVVEVRLCSFLTPEKGHPCRRVLISERSFMIRQPVLDYPHVFYEPSSPSEDGDATFYHGFRSFMWPSFQEKGIRPPLHPNEFHRGATFFVANTIEQAFEHPLHHHPHKDAGDTVCVFVFSLPLDILHGHIPPPGESDPLSVLWFPDADGDWEYFCIQNLFEPLVQTAHSYDIVIGPSCLPRGKDNVTALKVRGLVTTQVAFCTPRAYRWVIGCATRVFKEIRI